MTKQVQLRRGTTAEHSVFTGALAELTIDTDLNVGVVHDGLTPGGHYLVGAATTQSIVNKTSVAIGTNSAPYVLTVTDSGTIPDLTLTNCLADFTTNTNGYGQINVRNVNNGSTASGDVVITADNGTDTTNYIDLGINNSGFSTNTWSVNGPNDAYLFASDGSLSIGAGVVTSYPRYISFFLNGAQILDEKLRISSYGIGIGITNPTSQLHVNGDVRITGVITATTFSGQINAGISTLGITTFTGPVSFGTSAYFGDNDFVYFGDSSDLYIGHNGTISAIADAGTGDLYIAGDNSLIITDLSYAENKAKFNTNGSVELYYDNVKTFETLGTGSTVYGTLQSQGLQVTGVSTFTNGPVFIGAATSTGTSSQPLQVTGGVYVSGNFGIGVTNPQTKLQISGVLGFGATNNVRIGDNTTGSSITSGVDNIFIGSYAGNLNTTGSSNNFFGPNAGFSNQGGVGNNFFGSGAGYYNTGSSNNFFGTNTGQNNSSGNSNSFFGVAAGISNQTGSNNVFLGARNGISTSASYKVIIGSGYLANYFDSPDTNKSNQFAVGIRTDANDSKYWLVGDENFNIGIGNTNPTSKLQVQGDVYITGILTASSFSGNASSADQVKTVTASDNNANYYVTFVNSLNGSSTNETVYTDDGIYYNPGSNTFTTQHATFTGNVEIQSTLNGVNLNYTGVGTIANFNSTTSNITTGNIVTGIITTLSGTNVTYNTGIITTLSGTNVTYNTGNLTTGNIVTGIITTLSGTNVTYTTGNLTTGNIVTGVVTTLSGTDVTYTTGNLTTGNIVTGIITNLTSTNSTITNINSSGIITSTNTTDNTLATTNSGAVQIAGGVSIAKNLTIAGVTTVTGSTLFSKQLNVSGVATATTFVGALTGIAASATQLVTPRTFEITGDVIASPVFFDGTGNVSLAATIQPNSVALGSDTTGDYVQTISGTSNQITVTSGTGESSTPTLSIPIQFTAPQDVTVTRDLQVNRDLNVNGNITVGGTSATLFTSELKVFDADLVLGFRTDVSNNDISNDTTANHGGIAIASTEGTPLISLYDVGVGETNPATYKKIMWFKSGSFTGLGTDAWISNYAVGVGSTQVPLGVRLAAGGMKVTDTTVSTPQLSVSGVATATTFVGNLTGTASTTTNIPNLTGDITSNGTATSIAAGVIVNADISASASISVSKLAASTISGITLGNNLNTLTLNTSGTGLSGSTTYNGSGAATFTVTSNATSANTISTIVARDGSGNFSAGTITATSFSGSLANTLTLNTSGTGLSGSTTFNNSGAATFTVTSNATSANTVSTIVARDGSGNFSAGTITATLSGNSSTATTATNLSGGSVAATTGTFSTSLRTLEQVRATGWYGNPTGTSYTGLAVEMGVSSAQGYVLCYNRDTSAYGTLNFQGGNASISLSGTTASVTGSITATGTVTANSDIKLKTNIETISDALNKALSLRGVTYDRIDSGEHQIGVIAQEVEKIIPEVVIDNNGTKSVAYGNIVAVLIEAIKEQQVQINELRSEIDILKNK
jgi:hypothetical protein